MLNVRARWVAAALVPILIGATWAHIGTGWVFSNTGGGWEYPVFLIIATVVALQADTMKVTAPCRSSSGCAGVEVFVNDGVGLVVFPGGAPPP